LAVFAEPLVRLLYGPQFGPAVPLLRILAATLPLAVFGSSLSTLWLLPHGRDRAVTTVVVLACVLAIVLISAATPALGLEAAAWSLVVVELVTVAGFMLAVRRTADPGAKHRG
jgi:O-antigen/teichoic acid export membrane protein